MDGYRSLAGSAQYPNKNTFWPTRFQPCFAISISSQRVGVVVGESIKPVIVDLIKDLHIATAILGLDRIRMPSVEPHSRHATHDIPHRGAQGAGAQEVLVRPGPPNHRTRHRRTTAPAPSAAGCKSSALASLERGLRQLQAVAIRSGSEFLT
jgi:hypothetical protein